MQKILVCDDDRQIVEAIDIYLTGEGFEVIKAYDGYEVLEYLESHDADLLIIDVMMPGLDGIRTTLKVRENSSIPIIILSAKSEDTDKILGLNIGADDYITKPFGTYELMARIRTAIRHSNKILDDHVNNNRPYSAGGLVVDFEKRRVTVNDKEVHLTRVEYKIVSLLAKNSGKVITYDTIINEVWGPYADDNNRILRVNMANIRRKIEETPGEPKYIFTELGVGYRMLEDENLS